MITVYVFPTDEDRTLNINGKLIGLANDAHELGNLIIKAGHDGQFVNYFDLRNTPLDLESAMEKVGALFDPFDEQFYDQNGQIVIF